MEEAGLSIRSRSFSQAIITKEETIEYLRSVFSEMKPAVLADELITEDEYTNLVDSFGSDRYDHIQYSTFHKVAQIAAWK